MPAIFFILGAVMLYMFVFIASYTTLGVAKPLLSTAYAGLFLYCMFEVAMLFKKPKAHGVWDKAEETQRQYSRQLRGRAEKEYAEVLRSDSYRRR